MGERGKYFIYILTDSEGSLFYTGVTNDPFRRTAEHRSGIVKDFAWKYKLFKLVFVHEYKNIDEAILQEKRIKRWKKEYKRNLINEFNPKWLDLYEEEFRCHSGAGICH